MNYIMERRNIMHKLTVEELAAYLDNNLSAKEMRDVFVTINENDYLKNIVDISNIVDRNMDNSSLDLCETEFGPDFEIPHIDTDIIHNDDYIFPEKYFAPIELGEQYNFAKMSNVITEHDNDIFDNKVSFNHYINSSIVDVENELAQEHHVIACDDTVRLEDISKWDSFTELLNSEDTKHLFLIDSIRTNPVSLEKEIVFTDIETGEITNTFSAEQFEANDTYNLIVFPE